MSSEQERKKYLDMDTALSRVRGNKKLYHKMLGLFLNNEEFGKLDKSLEEKDYVSAGHAAHGVKGMTGNLALTLLFEKSTLLMDQMRNGDAPTPSSVEEYYDVLEQTRTIVKEVIEEIDLG